MNNSQSNKPTCLRHNPLVSFFVFSFVIAWAIWIPAGLIAPNSTAMVLPGAWAPSIAALLLTWHLDGANGVKQLLRRLLLWRVNVGYYLFAMLAVLGLGLVSLVIHVVLGGTAPSLAMVAAQFGIPADQAWLILVVAPLVYVTTIFVGGPIAEELGWRGFAQPRFQQRVSAPMAGLLIGFIWSLWHLPMFAFFPGAVGGLPLPFYIPLMSAFGVIFAWIYNRSDGSVLLCILFHAGINFALGVIGTQAIVSNVLTLSIFTTLTIMLAGYLATRMLNPGD